MPQRNAVLATSLLFLLIASLSGQEKAIPMVPPAAIRAVLQGQVEAWNRHDLEGFMEGYWNSPDLTFFSDAKETKGWEATLARYREKYQGNGAEMGKLEMSDLQVSMLGADSAFVRGRWQLSLSSGQQPHGLFTLIFRRFPQGWRIVHDHTSAAS